MSIFGAGGFPMRRRGSPLRLHPSWSSPSLLLPSACAAAAHPRPTPRKSPVHDFTPLSALIGGALIGLAASLYLLAYGRVCGISGILGGLVDRETEQRAVRLAFLSGLLAAGLGLRLAHPSALASGWTPSLSVAMLAGLLVGFGTRLGSGCTSGHGICGVSRLSLRSLIATLTFLLAGALTVFVARHLLGVGR